MFRGNLQVHELGYADLSRAVVFRGDKEVPTQQVGSLFSFFHFIGQSLIEPFQGKYIDGSIQYFELVETKGIRTWMTSWLDL